ncbi:MAG: hypothetical protein Q4D58_03965 [Synergistaceae bacterium]|nr:hypothetical protein [Synergistaceae bacterium]
MTIDERKKERFKLLVLDSKSFLVRALIYFSWVLHLLRAPSLSNQEIWSTVAKLAFVLFMLILCDELLRFAYFFVDRKRDKSINGMLLELLDEKNREAYLGKLAKVIDENNNRATVKVVLEKNKETEPSVITMNLVDKTVSGMERILDTWQITGKLTQPIIKADAKMRRIRRWMEALTDDFVRLFAVSLLPYGAVASGRLLAALLV